MCDILNIDCADGGNLPHKGYIETDIYVPHEVPMKRHLPCLLLVTPDTKCSARTPVILGTNVYYMSSWKTARWREIPSAGRVAYSMKLKVPSYLY